MVLNHLNLELVQDTYARVVYGDVSESESTFWERRLSTVQRRYLRSIESLARVRKLLGVTVQINIAADGGQQVVANG